jgi:hypothetical protein
LETLVLKAKPSTVTPIISEHFRTVGNELEIASQRLNHAKHSDIKGGGREALASKFLSSHLPKTVDFFTGEIIDPKHNRSPQIDLIIYGGNAPRLPLVDAYHLAFIDAVMAAVEVKSTLDSAAVGTCVNASYRLKSLVRAEELIGRNDVGEGNRVTSQLKDAVKHFTSLGLKVEYRDDLRSSNLKTTPYIVFAYTGMKAQSVISSMIEHAKTERSEHTLASHGPDMIINLEKGYYIFKDNDFLWPRGRLGNVAGYGVWEMGPDQHKGDALIGLYMLLSNLSTAFQLRPPLVNLPDYCFSK